MAMRACLMACAALTGCSPAHAAYPARPQGPVLDQAEVLPAANEATLGQRLTDYYRKSGNAIVVVTVKSLEGETIEDYANALYNRWGIGDARTDRGVLLLLAPNDRQARIEVGCGLEGTVTNGVAEQIMQTKLIPEYRQRHFLQGTVAGVDALIDYLQTSTAANDNGPRSEACRERAKQAGG